MTNKRYTGVTQSAVESSLSRIIRNYLNLSTFLFMSPYKFLHDHASRTTNANLVPPIQRIIVVGLQIFSPFCILVATVLLKYLNLPPSADTTLLNIKVERFVADMVFVTWMIHNISAKLSFSRHGEDTCRMLDCLSQLQGKIGMGSTRTVKILEHSLYIALFFHVPALLVTTMNVYLIANEQLVKDKWNSTGLPHDPLFTTTPALSINGSAVGTFLNRLAIIYEDYLTHFALIHVLIVSIALLASVKLVEQYASNKLNEEEVLSVCKLQIQLSLAVKRSTGGLTSGVCFGLLLYYTQMIQMLPREQWYRIFQFLYMVVAYFSFFLCGARTNSMVNALWKSLTLKEFKISNSGQLKLQLTSIEWEKALVLHAMNVDKLGLKSRFFTASYSLAGRILGYVVAYAIAIIQFNRATIGDNAHPMGT